MTTTDQKLDDILSYEQSIAALIIRMEDKNKETEKKINSLLQTQEVIKGVLIDISTEITIIKKSKNKY